MNDRAQQQLIIVLIQLASLIWSSTEGKSDRHLTN